MSLFKELVFTSKRLKETPKKKDKIAILSDYIKRLTPEDCSLAVEFLSGKIPYGKIGIGPKTLEHIVSFSKWEDSPVSLNEINETLNKTARIKGPSAIKRRLEKLKTLMEKLTPDEQSFLSQLILGELRQGALEGLMIDAIAKVANVSSSQIQRVYMFCGNLGEVARTVIEKGPQGLKEFQPKLFHPIQPMLALSVNIPEEAIEKLGEACWEYKFDGIRIQVHKQNNEVKIYSRHLRDITKNAPEVVEIAKRIPYKEFIIEGEALVLKEDGTSYPFQVTMQRFSRTKEVGQIKEKFPLSVFFFDCLYLDGRPLIDYPYEERRNILNKIVERDIIAPCIVSSNPEEIKRFFLQALRYRHEGLIAKSLNATYVAGHRGSNWLKLKAVKSLDLVILAAEWGHGRREGYLSNLHLGAKDISSGKFVMVGKTFKGLTDKMLKWQTQKLLELEIARDLYTVYVKPELVVEVVFNEIQKSPHYSSGLALRFARIKRYRLDKRAEQIDTLQHLRQMYDSQLQRI